MHYTNPRHQSTGQQSIDKLFLKKKILTNLPKIENELDKSLELCETHYG